MPVRYLSEIPASGTRPDIPPIEGAHAARGNMAMIPPEVVHANLTAAIKEITTFLNACTPDKGAYALDEVELTLHMDQAGEVNIIFGKAGLSLSQGIRLNWKRQTEGQQQGGDDADKPHASP